MQKCTITCTQGIIFIVDVNMSEYIKHILYAYSYKYITSNCTLFRKIYENKRIDIPILSIVFVISHRIKLHTRDLKS